jgi:hypothetical protein
MLTVLKVVRNYALTDQDGRILAMKLGLTQAFIPLESNRCFEG